MRDRRESSATHSTELSARSDPIRRPRHARFLGAAVPAGERGLVGVSSTAARKPTSDRVRTTCGYDRESHSEVGRSHARKARRLAKARAQRYRPRPSIPRSFHVKQRPYLADPHLVMRSHMLTCVLNPRRKAAVGATATPAGRQATVIECWAQLREVEAFASSTGPHGVSGTGSPAVPRGNGRRRQHPVSADQPPETARVLRPVDQSSRRDGFHVKRTASVCEGHLGQSPYVSRTSEPSLAHLLPSALLFHVKPTKPHIVPIPATIRG